VFQIQFETPNYNQSKKKEQIVKLSLKILNYDYLHISSFVGQKDNIYKCYKFTFCIACADGYNQPTMVCSDVTITSLTLASDQRDAQMLCFIISLYCSPLQVSSTVVFIIRRSNFINTASGIVTLCRWPSGAQVETGISLNLCTGRSLT
jgi:hypothetical protein